MKLSFFAFVFSLLCISICTAQEVLGQAGQSCNISGRFIQERELPGISEPLLSRGTMLFSCDYGLLWHTSEPIVETLIYTQQGNNYRLDERGDLQDIKSKFHKRLSTMLLNLVAFDESYLKRHFDIVKLSDLENSSHYIFEPKRKSLKRRLERVELVKDPSEVKLTLLYPAGEVTKIAIVDTELANTWQRSWCDRTLSNIISCDLFCSAAQKSC